jgi:hypothetical protein
MLADGQRDHTVKAMRNDEASAPIGFGQAVMFGSTTDELSAKLPAAETSVIAGIVLHTHAVAQSDLIAATSTAIAGPKPATMLNVLRKGRVWVTVEDAVVIGDRLWVRGVAAGDPEFLGNVLPADDSTDTVDCTNQGVFLSDAAAGGLAILEVDFTNRPT